MEAKFPSRSFYMAIGFALWWPNQRGHLGTNVPWGQLLYRLLKDVRFRPVVRDGAAVPYASLVREYRYQY